MKVHAVRSSALGILLVAVSAPQGWAQAPSKAVPSVILEEQTIDFAKGSIKVPKGSNDFTASSSRGEERDYENKAIKVTMTIGNRYGDAESLEWAAEKAKEIIGTDVVEKQALDKSTFLVVLAPSGSEQSVFWFRRQGEPGRHLRMHCIGSPAPLPLLKELCTSFTAK